MAVSIRLRREGAKNRPYYKVVVADSRSPRDGKFIELIGTYDPKVAGENSTLKIDRAEYWIARGAQPSDTVRSLLKKSKARAAVIRQLVEFPDEVMLSEIPNGRMVVFRLQMRQTDVGRIIGRNGQTIRAIRALLSSAAARHGQKATLDIVE